MFKLMQFTDREYVHLLMTFPQRRSSSHCDDNAATWRETVRKTLDFGASHSLVTGLFSSWTKSQSDFYPLYTFSTDTVKGPLHEQKPFCKWQIHHPANKRKCSWKQKEIVPKVERGPSRKWREIVLEVERNLPRSGKKSHPESWRKSSWKWNKI